MDSKEKKEKKSIIGSVIDLANGRFKDDEVETLFDIVTNRDKYIGESKTYRNSFTDWSSDGKYTRDQEYTYTLNSKNDKISIGEHYEYHDDDGQSGSEDIEHTTAREILNLLDKIVSK